MPLRDRHATGSGQPALFRSSHSDETYPYQHRNSVITIATNVGTTTLTQALLQSYPEQFIAATQAPFLKAAGEGRLPKTTLSRWLSQHRLYAETYISFITSLIPRVYLPYAYVPDKSKSLRWRIVELLMSALENIQRGIEFFEITAREYNLDLEASNGDECTDSFAPEQATQQYMDLLRSFCNDSSLPLIEGMVVLWATEQCFLSAWTYASHFLPESTEGRPDSADHDGGALRKAFIPGWSSAEFRKFADDITELTDLLAQRENAGKKLEVYKAVWSHVLDIETRFWPSLDIEDTV